MLHQQHTAVPVDEDDAVGDQSGVYGQLARRQSLREASSAALDNNNDGDAHYEPQQLYHDHRHHHHDVSSDLHHYYYYLPWCFRFPDDDNEDAPLVEASGLAVDVYARATLGMSSIFLGPALLELAAAAAGCPVVAQEEEEEECTNTIYGFRPSSLLTNLAAVSGILGCIALPLFGSIVDHTVYRRHVGGYTAVGLTIVKGIEVTVGPRTWLFVASLQVVSSLLFYIHITASYAYISELSSDSAKQASYNTSFFIIMYVSTLVFMMEVMGLSTILGTGDVGTARVSQTVTVLTCAPCFYFAWTYLFRDRPALSQVPEGMSLLTAGFRKLLRTLRQIRAQHRALIYLMLAIAFSEAAGGALIAVSTTYMKNVLNMNANEST